MAHTNFPADLPIPIDDGACAHLQGSLIPSSVKLSMTSNRLLPLANLPGLAILFCYPRTGAPGEVVSDSWNAIPGARGCTPQACSFRDHFRVLQSLGVTSTFGISTQSSAYQREAKERLGLPYELLSDEQLEFVGALKLPTFEWEGQQVMRRVTLAVVEGRIEQVWYPVFPPDKNVDDVIAWLKQRKHKTKHFRS